MCGVTDFYESGAHFALCIQMIRQPLFVNVKTIKNNTFLQQQETNISSKNSLAAGSASKIDYPVLADDIVHYVS